MTKSEDIITVSDECLTAIEKVEEQITKGREMLELGAFLHRDGRKRVFAILQEHYPELEEYEFSYNHETHTVTVTCQSDYRDRYRYK